MPSYKRFALMIAVVFCSAEAFAAPSPPSTGHGTILTREEDRFDFSHKGERAPKAAFLDVNGKWVTLARFRGRPLLINLWATWCGPCIKELPAFDSLAGQSRGTITIIAISEDAEGAPKVLPFWQLQKLHNLAPYMDPKGQLGVAANMGGLPATILYDSKGAEVWRASGGTQWLGPIARRMIAKAR